MRRLPDRSSTGPPPIDISQYQEAVRGMSKLSVQPNPGENWRPPQDTSEEERQAMYRGHTVWKTRFDGSLKWSLRPITGHLRRQRDTL